ncbi:MAG: nuclear transport factor 2 family protein [Terricaulis sp.]
MDIGSILRRYADAWSRGDSVGAAACYHDAFTLHYYGRNALSGVHAGKAVALATLADFSRRSGYRLVAISEILTGDHRGAILARVAYRAPDGMAERDRMLVYAVADNLLRECWAYNEDDALIDELVGPS